MEVINNSLNWFEIPVVDFQRAKKFYSTIYQFEMPETNMGKVTMGFFPVQPHHIGGAIVKGDGYVPSDKGSFIYLNGGDDLQNVLIHIEKAGGKILQQKTQITPELGYFAIFNDTEGNRVALHSMH